MQMYMLEKAEPTLFLAPHIFFNFTGSNVTETWNY